MYASRTSEVVILNNFENFYRDLLLLAKKYELNGTPLKIEQDLENTIVKIFGENHSSLNRAKNGLNDVLELGYTTAEHHPYWKLLDSCSEITNTILEKWNDSITTDDIRDIEWNLKEFNQSFDKIKNKNS